MGKLFERIINNRIKNIITFTETQAGGQQGKSTTDHINILYDRDNSIQIYYDDVVEHNSH
jgi:hypothetical protein